MANGRLLTQATGFAGMRGDWASFAVTRSFGDLMMVRQKEGVFLNNPEFVVLNRYKQQMFNLDASISVQYTWADHELLLICSDGLYSYVTEKMIHNAMIEHVGFFRQSGDYQYLNPSMIARCLVERAVSLNQSNRSYDDDVTCILLMSDKFLEVCINQCKLAGKDVSVDGFKSYYQ